MSFTVALAEKHLWEVGKGELYDVVFTFGDDRVESYFGLREVRLEGKKFLINGKSVFQRLILDQGFYPDGIYTAPTDDALREEAGKYTLLEICRRHNRSSLDVFSRMQFLGLSGK